MNMLIDVCKDACADWRKMLHATSGAIILLTGVACGGTVQDDVVLDLEFIGDSNGNGRIDAGEIVNRLRPYDQAGLSVEVKGTGTLPALRTFKMAAPPYPAQTNDVEGLTFAQDVVENEDGSHTAYKTGVVINNGVVTGLTETVYIRFFWEGPTLPSADCQSILFENGFDNWNVVGGGFGVYLSSSRTDAKRTGKVGIFVPQKFPSPLELTVQPNRWTDLFVTLRPNATQEKTVADAWVCQDTGLYNGGYFGSSPLSWAHGSESWNLPLLCTSAEKCNKLFLGAEGSGTSEIPAGTTTVTSGAKCMRGKIAAVKTWRRMLTTNEMWSVMCGGTGAKWRIGVINDSAEEFAPAGSAADPYNPLTMPWRLMKRSLTSDDRTLTLKFPMTAEDVGKGRVLDIVPLCSDVGASCPVDVSVNGNFIGRYDLKTAGEGSIYIHGNKVGRDAGGEMTITLTRPEGCVGSLAFDSLSLAGSWQTGTGTNTTAVPNGGMAQEGHNTIDVSFAGNPNYLQTCRSLVGSHTKNVHVFYVPPTGKALYRHLFHAYVGNLGKTPQEVNVTLNGHEIWTSGDVVKTMNIDVELPDEWILPGQNEVALNYPNVPNNDWLVFYRFGVETRRKTGMTIVVR